METITKYEVKEITFPERTFVTKRAKLSFDKLPDFFTENYRAIEKAVTEMGVQTNEPPCAIYYSVDEAKKETDLAAAIPVKNLTKEIKGFEKVVIPKSKALIVTHYGSYETMEPAYTALEKYLVEHKLKKEWMIEEYFTDPMVEKDPAKWKTNIYFVVK